ncbi:Rho termination factor N-terminal domain-containing protein [Ruegeria sp. HKCCD8929]|uniref:Rho termination factor N-terminal domain-containing protein n=1 Tax=Ruegeria sp. HKCCD8929 TaxID=2683006 RepID=UPI00148868B9|nr:Rho termination factor N-terminal domain-containing protein [Ruegeria sp. HKCCD8929]
MANKQIDIVLTAAIAIGGKIQRPGAELTVAEDFARSLLERGKAKLATGEGDGDGDDEDKPLDAHTVAELREIAKEYEIVGADKMKKPALIEAIEAAEAE